MRALRILIPLLACAALAHGGPAPAVAPAPRTPVALPEDGIAPVGTWILQYDPHMEGAAIPTYHDLLAALPKDARIVVAATTQQDADDFALRLGFDLEPDPRVTYVVTGQRQSGWARDRYILFEQEGKTRLLLPPEETVAENWQGDLAVARALPRFDPALGIVESQVVLEGGNVICGPDFVLVGPQAILSNMDHLRLPEDPVRARLSEVFARPVVMVGEPETPLSALHIDLYVAFAGGRRLLLGDPRLALPALRGPDADPVDAFGTFHPGTQTAYAREYDRIAEQLTAEGFQLTRIPVLHGEESELLTWTNGVTEARDGRRHVYLPTYGLPHLDAAAVACWKELGFEVHPIACEDVIGLGGAVRCLTNTMRAAPPPPPPPSDAR